MLRILRNSFKIHSQFVGHRYASTAAKDESQEFIDVNESNGVREITLNHPRTLNSLSMDMMTALHNALIKNKNETELRCIVLSASGKIWSAGHNLKELHSNPELQECVFQKLTDIILDIQKLPVPVIGKINGYAAAAGCQLAASCDIIVCTEKSKFSTPGANVGVFCSTPGIAISRSMPRSKSAYMLMTGLPITGKEAYIAGLVSNVVAEEDLDKEMEKIICAITSKSRAVIALGKEFYYKQMTMPIETAYLNGKDIMCSNLQLEDCKEGIQSFMEKRSPKWKH